MKCLIAPLFLVIAYCSIAQTAQRKAGSPVENLPANIQMLTTFGERADFSPDNKRIAFMTKSFGDAMMIDLKREKLNALPAMFRLQPF